MSSSKAQRISATVGKELLVKTTGELLEGKTVTFLGRQIKRNADSIELVMNDFMCGLDVGRVEHAHLQTNLDSWRDFKAKGNFESV